MMRDQLDRRLDHAMREYVNQIIVYLQEGGEPANARMNMMEHGVPPEVQMRVIEGKASLH